MSARARDELSRRFRMLRLAVFPPKRTCRIHLGFHLFRKLPRPRYCACCRDWAWCTNELAAYSTAYGFLCEECAEANDKETEHAWASFHRRG